VNPPSIADLLEHTSRELAASDSRVYRRVATHLERSGNALTDLETPDAKAAPQLLGQGSFMKQSVARLKVLCREQGLKGTSKLKKAELAALLERHGVVPPPPPLESFSKKELIAMLRQLLAQQE
jgi:hypothetical protein